MCWIRQHEALKPCSVDARMLSGFDQVVFEVARQESNVDLRLEIPLDDQNAAL